MTMYDQSMMLIHADARAREAKAERDRLAEALRVLVRDVEDFGSSRRHQGALLKAKRALEESA